MDATILLFAPRDETALPLAELLRGAGCRVHRAASLDAPPAERIDLVILDGPPGETPGGGPRPGAPLLLLADDEPAVPPPGEPAVFLRRPVSPAQLLGHVAALARLGRAEREQAADVGGRARAEQALRDSEALYHSLVEALPVCLFRKDLAGRFTFVNAPFCRELGRRADEVLGRTDRDFYPEELAAKYLRDDGRVVASGETFECVEQNVTPDGPMRFVQVIKAPLRDSAGRVIGVQGIFWDVTARRRAELELARTNTDIHCARKVQQRLFPAPRDPVVLEAQARGIELGGASYPVAGVGGDYFDFFRLGPGGLGVAVGDVSGHGIGPALLMAAARSYLRASARETAGPGEALSRVNSLLAEDVEGDRFITLALVSIDPALRGLSYASAGHATCYLFGPDGQVKHELVSTGVPLGIDPGGVYASHDVGRLEEGDLLVLLTDGVAEARDPEWHSFTAGRVVDLVRAYRQAPAREIAANLYHAVRAFSQNLPQLDDITSAVVKVRRREPAPSAPAGA
jgi:phosphoserine phosphatase RsbU/P